jgi:hypothetical protein
MLRRGDYAPVELHIDALDRLDHLPREKPRLEAAVRALDEYLGKIPRDGPLALPGPVADAYALEFSLRGELSRRRLAGFTADLWDRVRAELKGLERSLANGWSAFPSPPTGRLPRATESAACDWSAWPGSQLSTTWGTGPYDTRTSNPSVLVDQTAMFRSGRPCRALLFTIDAADQVLRVLESRDDSPPTRREVYRRYREELGERIVEPFARGVSDLATAGDLDGVLDRLDILHAMPIGVPAMARLRASVVHLFPATGPAAPFEALVRSRRFRELAGPPGPPTLPDPPPEPPPANTRTDLGSPTATIEAGADVFALALSPDGGRLVVAREGKADRTYDLPAANVVGAFDIFAGNQAGSLQDRTFIAFGANGSRLAATSASDTVRLFNTNDRSLVREIRHEARKAINTMAFAPGEGLLLIGQSGRIRVYNTDGEWLAGEAFPYDDLSGRIDAVSDDGRLALIEGQGRTALDLAARRSLPRSACWAGCGRSTTVSRDRSGSMTA